MAFTFETSLPDYDIMKNLILLFSLVSLLGVPNASAQNTDLKKAIKHYHSHNYGLAQKEILDALKQPFSSDEEIAQTMYYYFKIQTQVYSNTDLLREDISISEKIAESYTYYLEKSSDASHKSEMRDELIKLTDLMASIAEDHHLSKHFNAYFYTMELINHIFETIGEPTGEFIEILAENATKIGDQLRSISYWHKMIEIGYKKEFAYQELLSMLYNLKKYDQVDVLLSKAKSDFPESFRFAEVEILRHMDKGMKYSALMLAKKVAEAEPQNIEILFLHGLLSSQHNDHEEALESFIKVAHMQTDHFETNYELGKYYYRFNRKEGHLNLAIEYLEKAYLLRPESQETKELLYSVYLETGEKEKAMAMK